MVKVTVKKAMVKKASVQKGAGTGTKGKVKSPKCRTCGKRIRVPKGWSAGPAVRRHYWREHRSVMQPEKGAGR